MLGRDTRPPRRHGRKIVILRPGCCLEEGRMRVLGCRPVRRLPLVNGVVVDFPAGADVRLAAELPEVLRVDDDLVLRLVDDGAGPRGGVSLRRFPRLPRVRWPWPLGHWPGWPCRRRREPGSQQVPWGVAFVRAREAWRASRGEGVRVAALDTGVDLRHPDLRPTLAGGYNALAPGRDPADDNGHGTHVAGILAAADDERGLVGVAPGAAFYAVKVLDAWGSGFLSDLVEGLGWCVRERMQVVNLSLGTREDNETFREAVRNAAAAGLLLVSAAGNDGPGRNTVNYPARYPEVLAVAAVDRSGRLAGFSSRGPEVELAAPGVEVPSTWPGGGQRSLSGTSMASPHVAGAAALALGARGGQGPAEVRQRLVAAARRFPGSPYPVLDAAAAVR